MKPSTWPATARDLVLRMFPHRAPTGLVRLGHPGRSAPVLLTGNFTLTVRRIEKALAGQDAWLLVANSNGINVWCAAGGGHLTHHDVIAVIRTSGIGDRVDHRSLWLPQLGATGIERRKVSDATGWQARWGPAHLEDLPAVLRRGGGVRRRERSVRFPLGDRLEMAAVWAIPMTGIGAPLVGWLGGRALGLSTALAVPLMVFGTFGALPWLRVTGRTRWLSFGFIAAAATAAGAVALAALGSLAGTSLAAQSVVCAAAVGILSIDLAGTTPWLSSNINTARDPARIDLVRDRCTGAADCVQVCPRGVLEMDGHRHKVSVVRADDCIQCGACIVQCPEDALRFRYADGRTVEAATIRSTRLNMLGARTVQIDPSAPG